MGFAYQRKKAGLSQAAVAEKLGVSDAAVCYWESGKNQPRAGLLTRIASLYGCSVDELLKEEVSDEGTD